MKLAKEEILEKIELVELLLKQTKQEVLKTKNSSLDGMITGAYYKEYSLEKIKRNCITIRQELNDVRKGCQER